MGNLLSLPPELRQKCLNLIIREAKISKKWILRNCKGSFKDPFLYLKITAVILFGLTAFLSPAADISRSVLIKEQPAAKTVFLAPDMAIKEAPELSFIEQNTLVAVSPPIAVTPQVLGALVGAENYEAAKKEVIEYTVEPGDNLGAIASRFNISLETLLWANDLNKNSLLQIGQKLIILPVSGVIHHVKEGQTLSEIAKTYKTDMEKIIAFNDLSAEGDIYIGDVLIVPDGVMPPQTQYITAPFIPIGSSYFICPIAQPCRITQNIHWYNAVDFSNGKCGEPIFAAAAGQILKVKLTNSTSRWAFSGAGNHLTILHPNGAVTFYGHLKTSLVSPGDYVSQGQMIALVGGAPGTPGAGNSTGCHIHFGVQGARNPFAY